MIISKDNFVTDNMTNTVCYSSLLPKESSGLDPQLREKMYAALKESVKTFKHYDLYNTRDIWSRDYMPVQLTKDLFPDFVIAYPKNLRRRVLRFFGALPLASFACKCLCLGGA